MVAYDPESTWSIYARQNDSRSTYTRNADREYIGSMGWLRSRYVRLAHASRRDENNITNFSIADVDMWLVRLSSVMRAVQSAKMTVLNQSGLIAASGQQV